MMKKLIALALALLSSACGPSPPAVTGPTVPIASSAAAMKPDVGSIESVSVTAEGRGPDAAAAVDEALKLAILQVNGTAVDLSSQQFRAALSVGLGRDEIALRSSGFAQLVSERSGGAVTDFKLLDISKSLLEKTYVAKIEAHVSKFRPRADSGRLKVVVAPLRLHARDYRVGDRSVSSVDVAEELRQRLVDGLSQNAHFSVLDRDFPAEVADELNLVTSGQAPLAEIAKVGQALSADLIWVGEIQTLGYQRHARALSTSDRPLVTYYGGAVLSHRLINVTTRQILLSNTITVQEPSLGPTTLPLIVNTEKTLGQMETGVASQAVSEVVTRLFPGGG